MKVIIDNGHGVNTPGKCSPDKTLREYAYVREIAKRLQKRLTEEGIVSELLVPEETDVSLQVRCNREAAITAKEGGAKNTILVSIHVNAAGSGQWMKAGGWCAYTSKGVTRADKLASCLYEAAKKHLSGYEDIMKEGKVTGAYTEAQRPFRTDYTDGDIDMESNFYILKNTKCPAVLTENLFMDNKTDYMFLLSDLGKNAIVELHVDGIKEFIAKNF